MGEEKHEPKRWNVFVGSEARPWHKLLLRFEWVCEYVAWRFSRWAFVEVLEYIGKLGLLGALILWFYPGCQERKQAAEDARKTKHCVAWQTLNSASGKPGNAGRGDALQDLNQDGVSLASVDLSGGAIFSTPLVLTNADLTSGNLTGASFTKPNFSGAKLNETRLERVRFDYGDFSGAKLSSTILTDAEFYGCDFSSADIHPDQCTNVRFIYCNFRGAFISLTMEKTNFTDRSSFTRMSTVTNTIFQWCNFVECHFNFPAEALTPDTFVGCNVYRMINGFAGVPTYVTNPRKNATVPIGKFAEWLDWLDQNRRDLDGYKADYDPFYKADIERVKREWPNKK